MPMPGPASTGRGLEMPEGDEGNNMNMESSLAATVEAQGKQLLEQQQRIRELEKRLDSVVGRVVVEGDDNNVNEPVQLGAVHVSEAPKENNEFNSAALYEFDQSMWDASLLLFFRKGSNWVEKLILVIGCAINYFLQLSLLLTISMNMLDTPYSPVTIQEMLAWRVEQAHANSQFDDVRGKSLLTRLCNQELWSYEQEEYKLMYAYLYKEVPGALLSTLGIIMWVLTIMREYRRSMEQALAVLHLPALEEGKKSEFEWDREAEEWTVVGMNRVKRILALVLLSLPRLGVTVCLGLIGCQYLAQTANLADIVLNAVALAFVMDVDELVADVLLTERLRCILPKIKPLSCGVRKRGYRCCPYKDMVRYAITAGLVAFALVYWLMPFEQNVRGAAMALCGGYQDFSYEGGTAESPPIVLKPASWRQDSFVSSCDEGDTLDAYLSSYYEGARYNDSVHNLSASSATAEYYATLQQQHVLQFAYARYQSFGGMFSSCARGEILGPQDPDSGERACIPIPKRLEEELQLRFVVHGHSQPEAPEDCARMNPANGCDEYLGVLPGTQPACVWTWLAEKCDGNPPGNVNTEACGVDADILVRCQTWQSVLGRTDTKYNCNRILDYYDWGLCSGPNYDCVGFQGQYRVEPTNMTAGLTSAFKSVLMSQSGLTEQKISIHTEQIGPRKLLVRVCMFNLPADYMPLPALRTNMDGLLSDIQGQPNYMSDSGIVSLEAVPGTIYYTPSAELMTSQVEICEGGTTFVPGPV